MSASDPLRCDLSATHRVHHIGPVHLLSSAAFAMIIFERISGGKRNETILLASAGSSGTDDELPAAVRTSKK